MDIYGFQFAKLLKNYELWIPNTNLYNLNAGSNNSEKKVETINCKNRGGRANTNHSKIRDLEINYNAIRYKIL